MDDVTQVRVQPAAYGGLRVGHGLRPLTVTPCPQGGSSSVRVARPAVINLENCGLRIDGKLFTVNGTYRLDVEVIPGTGEVDGIIRGNLEVAVDDGRSGDCAAKLTVFGKPKAGNLIERRHTGTFCNKQIYRTDSYQPR